MGHYLPDLLVFLAAFLVTYSRLYTSDKFHNYFFLLQTNGVLLLNCLAYGFVGILLLHLLKGNVIKISDDNTTISHYLYPIGIGIATKGIADINFFNIKTDGFSFPVGLKTITQPLDKFFEEKLDGISFKKSKVFLAPYMVKNSDELQNKYAGDVTAFKKDVVHSLKQNHPDVKKTGAFETSQDFAQVTSADDLLVLVLREFGPAVFASVFPC
jgi:hypothetical protein